MEKITPLVSIIVVNYNGRQYLNNCFDSILKLNYPEDKIKIILVDNCSDDDSVSFVEKNFPKVQILKNDVNNYARANNLGIKNARGDFAAFINNDVQVDENWLIELINVMNRENRSGIVGGKILLKDGRIHSTGHEEYPDFYWGDRGFMHEDKGQYEQVEEVLSLCGAAVLFRKSCIDEMGPFDEDFIMYLEDVDMCFRCSKNKWKVLYVPKSIAKHHFRGTIRAESVRYFSERNRLLLVAKHFPMQLGEALYGKGYFTEEKNNIYDIFPLILAKLLEYQKIDAIKVNLPIIFKNLKNISVLEKSILMNKIEEFKNSVIQNKRDIELKNTLLRERESSIEELSRANTQLNEQIQKTKEELLITKDDLEKVVRFDKKIKILLVKPQIISIKDTEETIRIIKKKYPNSSIYLFANLLKQDYEKLFKNNDVEKSLIYSPNNNKLFIKVIKLFGKFLLTRFDIAVTLLSHEQTDNSTSYKKAKLISILSNSKNHYSYYID